MIFKNWLCFEKYWVKMCQKQRFKWEFVRNDYFIENSITLENLPYDCFIFTNIWTNWDISKIQLLCWRYSCLKVLKASRASRSTSVKNDNKMKWLGDRNVSPKYFSAREQGFYDINQWHFFQFFSEPESCSGMVLYSTIFFWPFLCPYSSEKLR